MALLYVFISSLILSTSSVYSIRNMLILTKYLCTSMRQRWGYLPQTALSDSDRIVADLAGVLNHALKQCDGAAQHR